MATPPLTRPAPFRKDLLVPAAPQFEALPNGGVVATRRFQLAWRPGGDADALAGYAYAVDRDGETALPETPNTVAPTATVEVPEDGEWRVLVRALDNWGNWSETATAQVVVDSVPLEVGGLKHRTAVTNPLTHKLPVSFTLSKPAEVTLTVLPARDETPVRTYTRTEASGPVRIEWDGRNERGETVPSGQYRYRLTVSDGAGNKRELAQDRMAISYKRIVVSLARQSLTAYDGERVALSTLVTTGGPDTWTPAGTFEIMTRQTPFTFRSPWPRGHPFWYEDAPASFAMLFADGGFFLHDAPWRNNFGPGSNVRRGTPGGDYTGTHGCVNIPYGAAAQLFRWTEVGVPIIVQ